MTEEVRERRHGLDFSRPLAAAQVPPEGLDIVVSANEGERTALARANDLPSVSRLEARLRVTRAGGGGLEVTGEIDADIRQTCVVTLEEFDAHVREPVHLRFAPEQAPPLEVRAGGRRGRDAAPDEAAGHHIGAADEDPPDPMIGDSIDLGAIAAEFLTLGLDPYPRKPGATFAEPAPAGPAAGASPFAKLRGALGRDRSTDKL